MSTKLEDLKTKRDQLNARIQAAESRARAAEKKAQDRIKVLVGAAVLESIRGGQSLTVQHPAELVALMDEFLIRPTERAAVLGENGAGSDTFQGLTTPRN